MGTKIKGTKILIYNAPEEKALFKNGFFYRFVTLQTPQPIPPPITPCLQNI